MPIGNVAITKVETKKNGSLRLHYAQLSYFNGKLDIPADPSVGCIPITKEDYEKVLKTFQVKTLENEWVYLASGFASYHCNCPGRIIKDEKEVQLSTSAFCPRKSLRHKVCFLF